MGYPTVYPTGVLRYDPKKAWSGYTIMPLHNLGSLLIDMNGREIRLWKHFEGFPTKLFPGGNILASSGVRNPKYGLQDQRDLVQIDFDGNIKWKWNKAEYISDPGEEPQWMARQHHDFQREGNPVGYYVPGMEPKLDGGNTLILAHKEVHCPYISEKPLLDDIVYEVDWDGDILWEWKCSDHVQEMGFSQEALNAMCRNPNFRGGSLIEEAPSVGDWMHINSMSVLGPNKWYDQGDERFHPDNIIMDGRETNIIFIVDKKTGKIVWQVGPDYHATPELRKLGWIIGQHHAHMIPKGLPGEGNILVFDNGGWAGYGAPNPGALDGTKTALRDYSRVIEFNPLTLEIVWQCTPKELGFLIPLDACRFYSPFISSAQRLPNGNTLITEGSDGRLLEVTKEHEIVWEYVCPYFSDDDNMNYIYRAYRVPYEWVPQLPRPEEKEIAALDKTTFRVPGAAPLGVEKEIKVEGTIEPYKGIAGHCVGNAE